MFRHEVVLFAYEFSERCCAAADAGGLYRRTLRPPGDPGKKRTRRGGDWLSDNRKFDLGAELPLRRLPSRDGTPRPPRSNALSAPARARGWLAPIPLLVAAFRAAGREARLLAWPTAAIGVSSNFTYYLKTTARRRRW